MTRGRSAARLLPVKPSIHPHALVESRQVGAGTRVWAFTHVMAGAVVGRDCNIGEHCYIEHGAVIGDRVTIKNHVAVWQGLRIDDDVFIGPHASLTNDRWPRSRRQNVVLVATHIRHGATIGANATIVAGATIGAYAFVGAGSVVARAVPDHALVVGNPARQRGWVCRCAGRLTFRRGRAICPSCRLEYRQQQHAIRCATPPSTGRRRLR